MKYLVIAAFILCAFLSACKKPDQYSDIPAIQFKTLYGLKDVEGYDTIAYLVIDFTDGDGDIGYKDIGQNDPEFDDPNSPYYDNYIIKLERKMNGVWTTDPTDINSRIPYLSTTDANQSLKGEIQRELPLIPHITNDTERYDVFIYDRAKHQSNTITTPEVVYTTH